MGAFALTDMGMLRSMNQDFVFASPDPVGPLENLFLVADGMGGHKAGDYASRFLIQNIVEAHPQSQTARAAQRRRWRRKN